ncbi:TasA family protein [Salarchaeum sp. III]|uniref:TasA family protein n=1 Tax=Salarchaeum sp. III TaxID=3107927 RepID=UPI002ED91475
MSDDDKTFELTRRRALGGLLTLGAAGAAGGAGTMAYFSDTEQSTDNTVSAGTLDLTSDGDNGPYTIIDVDNKAPGWSASKTTPLQNDGTIAGNLSIEVDSVTEDSGDNPESEPNDTADLAEFLDVTISFDESEKWSGKAVGLSSGQTLELGTLPGDDGSTSKAFVVDLSIPTDASGVNGYSDINAIQGDSVTVDATFHLEQQQSYPNDPWLSESQTDTGGVFWNTPGDDNSFALSPGDTFENLPLPGQPVYVNLTESSIDVPVYNGNSSTDVTLTIDGPYEKSEDFDELGFDAKWARTASGIGTPYPDWNESGELTSTNYEFIGVTETTDGFEVEWEEV